MAYRADIDLSVKNEGQCSVTDAVPFSANLKNFVMGSAPINYSAVSRKDRRYAVAFAWSSKSVSEYCA